MVSARTWLLCGSVCIAACAGAPASATAAPAGDGDGELETEPAGEGGEGSGDEVIAVTPSTPGSLLGEALRELGVMRASRYTHHTHVDEDAGRFEYDCSGFLDYALGRVAPEALRALTRATVRRPLARHIVDFLAGPASELGPWQVVGRADDLQPGDVIAWRMPKDVVSKNTGHVLIVRAAVRREGDLVAVPIIDSTSMRHGRGDSRTKDRATGLGTGEIRLAVDDSGAPHGYLWSRGKKARLHVTQIVLGRVGP